MIGSYQKDLLKSFTNWFEILAYKANNTNDTSGLPKLEVFLRSGNKFAGCVIGFQKSEFENLLMLLEEPDLYSKSNVHLIHCAEIVAVSLVEPKNYLRFFSKTKPTVSELELKRKTKSVEDQIAQTAEKNISIALPLDTISETDRYYLFQMIGSLPAIFESLCKDKLGKTTVHSTIERIEIQVSKMAQTRLKDHCLMLHLNKIPEQNIEDEKDNLLYYIEKAL